MSATIVPQSIARSITKFSGSDNFEVEEIVLGENTEVFDDDTEQNPTSGPPSALPGPKINTFKRQMSSVAPARSAPARSSTQAKSLAAKLRRADNAAFRAFKMFDIDGDGNIAVSELGNLAQKLGKDLSEEVINQIIKQCDRDGDSTLSLQEFKEIYHRFNEERAKEHQKQTNVMREKLDLNVSVSTSTKCSHTCVGAAETACCVYHKHLLLLASTLVMAVMIPLFGVAYGTDLSKISQRGYSLVWTPFWAFYPTWTIACYYYAFPKRQPIWLLALLAVFYAVVGCINGSAYACPNALFYATYSAPAVAPFGYKILRISMVCIAATVNMVLLFLYRGPVGFKALFGFAVFLIIILPSPLLIIFYLGWSSASAGLTFLVLMSCVISIRITECRHKLRGGTRIGGSRAYTAMMALMLPNVVQALTNLVYYAFHEQYSTTMTVVFFLVFTMVKLQVRDVLAIAASSALPDDITTVVFMFFPIFAFQYITELMYLSTGSNALSTKFFILMGIKIVTGSMTKGGFLIYWATSLRNWTRRQRKRHRARKTLLRGATRGIKEMTTSAPSNKHSAGETSSGRREPTKIASSKVSFEVRHTKSFMKSVKRDVACRQAELNCLWLVQKIVTIVFSFLSNTSGQTCHEIKGITEAQRMVQQTVVTFTLISMSNLSSLACNLGALIALFIEHIRPPESRVWFKGVSDEGMLMTLISFSVVLLANIFILFVSNWTKYNRWTKLQVLLHLGQMTPQNLIQAKSKGVRKAKAKFLHKLHRIKLGTRSNSHRELVDAAHGSSRAHTHEMLVDAEYHGNKLYMLERQVFKKHFWLLLLITIYVTYNCASFGLDKSYTEWLQREHGAFACNWTTAWTTALNGTRPLALSISWGPAVCGSGRLPDLNCTADCAVNYPNSSLPYWDDQNCTLYD